jgi:hypothetical protein
MWKASNVAAAEPSIHVQMLGRVTITRGGAVLELPAPRRMIALF